MWLSLIVLLTIVPAVAQAFRPRAGRDGMFWSSLVVAVTGPLAWIALHSADAWQTGLAATLWVTIAATMALYIVVAVLFPQAWRLASLLAGYMLLLGVGAIVWRHASGYPLHADEAQRVWIGVHIATAVVTYALVTIAAVAAVAAVLQEWTLKRKRSSALSRNLPSINDCDALQRTLLQFGGGCWPSGFRPAWPWSTGRPASCWSLTIRRCCRWQRLLSSGRCWWRTGVPGCVAGGRHGWCCWPTCC